MSGPSVGWLRWAAILLLFTAPAASAAPAQILGYYTQDGTSPRSLKTYHGFFNQMATDCYSVGRAGKIAGTVPPGDLAFARSQKMQTFATISNYAGSDFNADIAHAIMTSPAVTQTFIDNVTKLLAASHYTGLNLDFESIPAADRKVFTAFVQTVSDKMRQAGYLTVLSVPAAENDDPTNSWTGAFDLKALGAAADVVQLMTYDENGPWGSPGPVAGLDWVEACVRYAVTVVPAGKISLGVPAFAYDWDLSDSHHNAQLPWIAIAPLIAKFNGVAHWDASSSSPNFSYTQNGHRHIVWHENEKSICLKAQLAAKYKLAGVSVYALGQEDDSFWKAIHSAGF